jgi:hypothetical protein
VINYQEEIHPVGYVRNLVRQFEGIRTLSFSKYFYRPQWIFDERECFEVDAADVTSDWVHDQGALLQEGWELALNSIVKDVRGRSKHIGMIDFVGRPPIDDILDRVRTMVGRNASLNMQLYDSGRSIHGYVTELIGPSEWHKFLGRLLLMNSVGSEPIIDARWIGHRLLGGYAALRWSANSRQHSQTPRLIKQIPNGIEAI